MKMAESRTPRDLENRTLGERPKRWMPPQLLPDPKPEEGYSYRWIRISTLGNQDPMNISSKLREGWEPVKASAHPEIQLMSAGGSRYPDSIEIGGLLLCKIPSEFMEQRRDFYSQQADGQMSAVDNNFMRESDPRMPMFKDRQTKVTFGRGS
jgi:hypothetical protein